MTDVIPDPTVDRDAAADAPAPEAGVPDLLDAVDEQLLDRLVGQARAGGLQLAGEGGLLAQLTKRLVESALEGEITDHLGYEAHDAAGRDGGNSRNGHRSKTVLTDVGLVAIALPRDRDGSFEPRIVAKRKRRLSGIEELVLSLSAKGLTTSTTYPPAPATSGHYPTTSPTDCSTHYAYRSPTTRPPTPRATPSP